MKPNSLAAFPFAPCVSFIHLTNEMETKCMPAGRPAMRADYVQMESATLNPLLNLPVGRDCGKSMP